MGAGWRIYMWRGASMRGRIAEAGGGPERMFITCDCCTHQKWTPEAVEVVCTSCTLLNLLLSQARHGHLMLKRTNSEAGMHPLSEVNPPSLEAPS